MSAGRRSRFQWEPVTDEEFIERIRREVEFHRRWRWAPITARGGFVLVFIGVLVAFPNQWAGLALVFDMFENRWIISNGFGVGLLLGLALGRRIYKLVFDVIFVFPSLRAKRLLPRFQDALPDPARADPLGVV